MNRRTATLHVYDVMGAQHITIDVREWSTLDKRSSEAVVTAQTTVPVQQGLEPRDWLGEALVAVLEVL